MIEKPRLVISVLRNSSRIFKSTKIFYTFQPHFKTHQSIEVGRWLRDLGISDITVSSMDMLTIFLKIIGIFLLALPYTLDFSNQLTK